MTPTARGLAAVLLFGLLGAAAGAESRVVLVTGGSRGIGRSICHKFAARGFQVVCNFKADREAAEQLLEELPGDGHSVHQCDVADPAAVATMFTQISKRYSRLDVLVANAAIYEEVGSPLEANYDDWQRCWRTAVETNLLGPAWLSYCATHIMARQPTGGAIVAVSSRGAFRGEPSASPYGASKAGLNSMCQSLSKAVGGVNIGVSAVAPGFVATEMSDPVLHGPRGDFIRGESPFGRVAKPEEVAEVVYFLAHESSRWTSGAVVDCNGASYLH